MWIAVIPAHNEADSITKVLQNLLACHCFHRLILVANGCTDDTVKQATKTKCAADLIEILSLPEPLGIDIPRAFGAARALQKYHPTGIVFVDGDLAGKLTSPLLALVKGIEQGLDLALTDCYPCYPPFLPAATPADSVLKYRGILNKKLGLDKKIGLATPSHGPHAISSRLLTKIPLPYLAIPPLVLAFAAQHHFRIGVAATIPHDLLGSKIRGEDHATKIAATIIADCQQAIAYLNQSPDSDPSTTPPIIPTQNPGYQSQRRFDLLNNFLSKSI